VVDLLTCVWCASALAMPIRVHMVSQLHTTFTFDREKWVVRSVCVCGVCAEFAKNVLMFTLFACESCMVVKM
jgi:hypothetical protein